MLLRSTYVRGFSHKLLTLYTVSNVRITWYCCTLG